MSEMRTLHLEQQKIADEAVQIVREMLIGTQFEKFHVSGGGHVAHQPTIMAVDVDELKPCREKTYEYKSASYTDRFYRHFSFAFDLREIHEFYGKDTERWIRFVQQRCMDASEKIQEVGLFSVSVYEITTEDVEKGRLA